MQNSPDNGQYPMTIFYSDVKYSPAMLHLSPATRITQTSLMCWTDRWDHKDCMVLGPNHKKLEAIHVTTTCT